MKNMGRHLGLREKLLRPGIGLGYPQLAGHRCQQPQELLLLHVVEVGEVGWEGGRGS